MKPIDYRQAHGMSTADFIKLMNTKFPKYTNASDTMCNRSEEYGVCLTNKAVKFLEGKRKSDKRIKSNQMTVRLSDADKSAFDKARLRKGHTIQQATEEAIMLYIKSVEGVSE